jgi:predicted transglutaminase-like cysteine proteinase
MRQTANVLAIAITIAATGWTSISEAAFFSYPRLLRLQMDRIAFEEPTLAPMGHTVFCLRYEEDCAAQKVDFRKRNIALTVDRLNELNTVNRQVNRDITPQPNLSGRLSQWVVSPSAGDCNDYAVTKRHELLERGWPSRSLLLSEVVVPSGEHHLVLVVHMTDADQMRDIDLVLDNLNASLRPVEITPYKWVRMESPSNPKYWLTVSVPSRLRTAMATNAVSDSAERVTGSTVIAPSRLRPTVPAAVNPDLGEYSPG